jgi:hypothetical protein
MRRLAPPQTGFPRIQRHLTDLVFFHVFLSGDGSSAPAPQRFCCDGEQRIRVDLLGCDRPRPVPA